MQSRTGTKWATYRSDDQRDPLPWSKASPHGVDLDGIAHGRACSVTFDVVGIGRFQTGLFVRLPDHRLLQLAAWQGDSGRPSRTTEVSTKYQVGELDPTHAFVALPRITARMVFPSLSAADKRFT